MKLVITACHHSAPRPGLWPVGQFIPVHSSSIHEIFNNLSYQPETLPNTSSAFISMRRLFPFTVLFSVLFMIEEDQGACRDEKHNLVFLCNTK